MVGAGRGDGVLDLYAGIGTISVAIGREAAQVTAIEENPRAVQLGRLNARINSARVEYVPGRVEKALKQVRIGRHGAAGLDPPRAGRRPSAPGQSTRPAPDRLAYLSSAPSDP